HRSRMLSVITAVELEKNPSYENTLSLSSTSTEIFYRASGQLKEVTSQDGKAIVDDIIGAMFAARAGVAKLSSSTCELDSGYRECEDMDRRLKLWQDTLRARERMQHRINKKTGKMPGEMLINLPASLEQRDKGTINRLMDYAQRMNPVTLSEKKGTELPRRLDMEQCMELHAVQETLPKAEQAAQVQVEISGLTKATMAEIMPDVEVNKLTGKRGKWITSNVLKQRIEQQAEDMDRVLDYFPDTQNLEVVGNNMLAANNMQHVEDIDLIVNSSLYSISSSTISCIEEQLPEETVKSEPQALQSHNLGLKINNVIFTDRERRTTNELELQIDFECAPYEKQLKEMLRLENVGRCVIICEWQNLSKRATSFMDITDDSFLLECNPITLFPGDVHIPRALFQPHMVGLHNRRIELRIFPNIFCHRNEGIVLRLQAKCVPHADYAHKLDKQTLGLIDKANQQSMDRLTARQAELAVVAKPQELLCPYERLFDEREVFNAENAGYKCERFDDLLALRRLYNTVKLPREPEWDWRLDTLKQHILRLPDALQREQYFELMLQVQSTLKCSAAGDFAHYEHNRERERSRFIYVRGCIGNGIEEWEQLMLTIEQNAYKSELARFQAQEPQVSEEDEDAAPQLKPWWRQLRLQNPELYVLKKLRSNKFYRDSLYMQTYSHLCDLAENIVSVIESTEFI
ncbi:CG30384, partial [Drosophila busckii]